MPSKSSKVSDVRENDRVMVFIDGSNLYHVLSQQCGRHDLQFDKFALKLANGRKLQRTYYYNIRQESEINPTVGTEQQKFLESMYDTPYVEVRLGIWKQRGEIMVEKGVDVMLATDLVTNAYNDHYDTAVVVSGDADFYPALQAVKDVGKHIEVAAFDMNLSTESARVSDVVQKLNKTFFTGLWMTRAQARARAASSTRPEVSDEAASPNGEDKAATKTTSTRRSSTRKSSTTKSTAGTKTRRASASRTRKTTTRKLVSNKEQQEDVAAEPNNRSTSTMRRTPSRRKVGSTNNVANNGRTSTRRAPKPPALRKKASSEENAPEPEKVDSIGSPSRRRSWRGRLGLSNSE
mgnify:FL=1